MNALNVPRVDNNLTDIIFLNKYMALALHWVAQPWAETYPDKGAICIKVTILVSNAFIGLTYLEDCMGAVLP